MRPLARIALPVAAAVVLSACAGGPPADVAASAGDVEVATSQLVAALDAAEAGGQFDAVPQGELAAARLGLQRQALTALVQVALVSAAAEEQLGVTVDEADLDAAVLDEVELAGGEEALDEQLAAAGLDRTQLRQQLEVQLLIEAIRTALEEGVEVTDDDVRAAYDARSDVYQQATVRHILLDTEADAEAALARLDEGEDFSALAEELSVGPSGPNGGELGTAPRGQYVPAFDDAVWDPSTEQGEVVGPVQTEFGWHLILVDEFQVVPFEDAEPALRTELENGDVDARFQALVEGALAVDVEVQPRFGTWDATSQSVVGDPSSPFG